MKILLQDMSVPPRLQVSTILMVLLLCNLCRVRVARVIAEAFGFIQKIKCELAGD